MAVRQDTIWQQFLSPVVRFFIDEKELRRFYESIDWQKEGERFRQPDVIVPSYYSQQNFHGIEGGYLNPSAAVSYDPITQYVLPPNETLIRQGLIDAIQLPQPRRILDLGCGTGATTLMLQQSFPEATVIGLDLSPYMLVRAEYKAQVAGLKIQWRHGNGEKTDFADASFDLVTAALLFHETPPTVSQAILVECFRLLKVGGQVLILDGNQKVLRQLDWLNNIFEEPYIRDFAAGSVDAWMGSAGFQQVQTQDLWWVHQVTSGVKPILTTDKAESAVDDNSIDSGWDGFPAPAFS